MLEPTSVTNHLEKVCPYRKGIEYPCYQCGELVTASTIKAHFTVCKLRKMTVFACPRGCGEEVNCETVDEHMEKTCRWRPDMPFLCPYGYGEEVNAETVDEHMEKKSMRKRWT